MINLEELEKELGELSPDALEKAKESFTEHIMNFELRRVTPNEMLKALHYQQEIIRVLKKSLQRQIK